MTFIGITWYIKEQVKNKRSVEKLAKFIQCEGFGHKVSAEHGISEEKSYKAATKKIIQLRY